LRSKENFEDYKNRSCSAFEKTVKVKGSFKKILFASHCGGPDSIPGWDMSVLGPLVLE
jgi:hypothetical protein